MFQFFFGWASFGYGLYNLYRAIELYRLFQKGNRATAKVIDIEVEIRPSDGEDSVAYYLVLELPPYKGVPLQKKYEHPIHPSRYTIGEEVRILQRKDYPTEVVVVKELTFQSDPWLLLIAGIGLIGLAFFIWSLDIQESE